MDLITFADKVSLQEDPSVADINKLTAADVNEIKSVVNSIIQSGIDDAIDAKINAIYPVGSILINTTGTNPANYLGVGTWIAWGAGRVPVGRDSSDTKFDTAEETGGTETVTLTTDNLPSHRHTISSHTHTGPSHTHGIPSHTHTTPNHTHSWSATTGSAGGHYHRLGNDFDGAAGSARYTPHSTGINGAGYTSAPTSTDGAHTHWVSGTTSSNNGGNTGSWSGTTGSSGTGNTGSGGSGNTGYVGGGDSFSILQPYIVCYMWKRTA